MIQNTTPEEKAWWDREMNSYLKKRTASPARAALIIFIFVSVVAGIATCHENYSQPALKPVGEQPRDSIYLEPGHQDADGTIPLILRIKPAKKVQ